MAESDEDPLSPADLQHWLKQELLDVTKAAELRVQDATDFVTKYATGELDAKAAMERLHRYSARWGDAIYGVIVQPHMTNGQILELLDHERNLSSMTIADEAGNHRLAKRSNRHSGGKAR